jgi:hypothetical protein
MSSGRRDRRGGRVTPHKPPVPPELMAAADRALATNEPIVFVHNDTKLCAVPDVLDAWAHANGEPLPDTWQVRRYDQRTCQFYLAPEHLAVSR